MYRKHPRTTEWSPALGPPVLGLSLMLLMEEPFTASKFPKHSVDTVRCCNIFSTNSNSIDSIGCPLLTASNLLLTWDSDVGGILVQEFVK